MPNGRSHQILILTFVALTLFVSTASGGWWGKKSDVRLTGELSGHDGVIGDRLGHHPPEVPKTRLFIAHLQPGSPGPIGRFLPPSTLGEVLQIGFERERGLFEMRQMRGALHGAPQQSSRALKENAFKSDTIFLPCWI